MSASKKSTYIVFSLDKQGSKIAETIELHNKQQAISIRNKFRKVQPLIVFEVYKIELI